MRILQAGEIDAERSRSGRSYLEFLRVPALSAGLYVVAAGADDPQTPHSEDEIYYVLRGRARFACGEEDHAVGPGTVLFVEAGARHRFHSVSEELAVLVVFGPAESESATP